VIATTGIVHFFGTIFQPIFRGIAWLLAAFYGVIPNYMVAITLLTIVIMVVLTPFTVKSTKSMMSMQRLQPELKKLQQKYKGPENRQLLQEEMMRLYREEGVNPLGGCLPMLLQAPFLFILYSVIKGLANKNALNHSQPRYIPTSSQMYHNLIQTNGQIKAFGMDLGLKPFSSHSSWEASIPFFVFVAVAVALQYFQMWQLNNRNRVARTTMPAQQQAIQRFFPILFAYIYIIIPAAVVVYMIVSTIIRIITQDVMFRLGVSDPRKQQAKEREIPARSSESEDDAPAAIAPAPKPKSTGSSNGTKPRSPAPKPKPTAPNRSKAKRQRKDR
jgi:YidC/Oxa1 family membrane protein insertase